MSKKICVIGTGYVGLVASVGLADFGNTVIGADIIKDKIENLKKGISPIYEPGIELYLNRNLESGRLMFTSDVADAVANSEVIIIAVGTPPKENGEADLQYIESAAKTIAENLSSYKVVVTKSTVPVGTNKRIYELISKYAPGKEFDVVSNPEFLREGKAVQDFFHPDRTVIGYESERAKEVMHDVYRSLNLISVPFVWCNLETAEMIKYAANAFLATKITFINQIANMAEAVGADVHMIAKSMGMDGRISPKFLHPGPGYGGSCFPKDTKALADTGKKLGVDMSLIDAVITANEKQKYRMFEKLCRLLGDGDFLKGKENIKGKTVGILGLAFKQETDDIRDTPAFVMVEELQKAGALIKAHDPQAMDNFSKEYQNITYCVTSYDAAKGSDCLILMTDWNEYRGLDPVRIKTIMKGNVILDTRNLLDPVVAEEHGFIYEGVGRK